MPRLRPLPKPPKGLDEGKIFREVRDLAMRRLRAVGPELISDQVFHAAFTFAKDRINRRIGEFHGAMANHFAGTGAGQSSFVTQISEQSIRRAKEIEDELRIELATFRNRHNVRVAARAHRKSTGQKAAGRMPIRGMPIRRAACSVRVVRHCAEIGWGRFGDEGGRRGTRQGGRPGDGRMG